MDSLDAQSLIIEKIETGDAGPRLVVPPPLGRALLRLLARHADVFTWGPDAVADMARQWRESRAHGVPNLAHPFLSAHLRLEEMFAEEGKAPADTIVHDFARRAIEARWEKRKVVVIVDEIPERRAPPAPPEKENPA